MMMRNRNLGLLTLLGDLLWACIALALAIALREADASLPMPFYRRWADYLPILLGTLLLWTILYSRVRLDGFSGGWHVPSVLAQLLVGILFLMVIIIAAAYLAKLYVSRLVLAYYGALLWLGFVGIRSFVRRLLVSRHHNGTSLRTVILGEGRLAKELASKIASHPEVPYRVVGFLYPSDSEAERSLTTPVPASQGIRTLGIRDLLLENEVAHLIVVHSRPPTREIANLIACCRRAKIRVSIIPDWYELYASKIKLVEFDGLPLLSVEEHSLSNAARALKRGLDLVLGSLLLVLVLPFLLASMLWLLSKGRKPIRKEARCGEDGRVYDMYRLNVDRGATDLGRHESLLCSLSATELPQLWNVLVGQMSLVGPRPEAPERVKHYSEWQRQRLSIKPGLTGLAQVHGLRDQHSSDEKTRYDLQYILQWSPFLDLSLILQTLWTLVERLGHAGLTLERAGTTEALVRNLTSEIKHADRTQPCSD